MANMVNITNSEYGKRNMEGNRTERFVMMLTERENQAIQEFRFSHRFSSKAEAARTLIELGLNAAATGQ